MGLNDIFIADLKLKKSQASTVGEALTIFF
jgi:hypothetical protein